MEKFLEFTGLNGEMIIILPSEVVVVAEVLVGQHYEINAGCAVYLRNNPTALTVRQSMGDVKAALQNTPPLRKRGEILMFPAAAGGILVDMA